MKKLQKYAALLTAGMIWGTTCFGGLSVQGAEQGILQPEISVQDNQIEAASKTTTKRRGWYTLKDGVKQRYYDKNGNFLVGKRMVKGKIYYFNKNGILQKNKWITINGKKYYFGADGVKYVGVKKINGKYYFFDKRGILKTTTTKEGNTTYYIRDNGTLEARKKGSKYYHASGSAMGKTEAYEYETFQRAKSIVADITTPSMSDAQKLETCFRWVMAKYYTNRRIFLKQEGWPALYANDHFLLGGGDCYSDGCAFGYLAKALGYKNIYACVDTDKANNNGHCWTEINGRVYDPLFAQAKSFSRNYGVTYGVYPLSPRLKVKI